MSRTRLSRALLVVICIVGLLGVFAYVYKPKAADDRSNKPAAATTAPSSALVSADEPALALPATAPATRPAVLASFQVPATQPAVAGDVLVRAKARIDAADLLAARTMLNDALVSNQLSSADAVEARALISQVNQTIIFSPRHFPDDPFGGVMTVPPGGVLAKIARTHGTTPELLARVNDITDPRKLRAGATLKVIVGPFHAVVTKSKFTMDLYLGSPGGPNSVYVTSFPVGLGKDDSTPSGTWMVEPGKKLKDPVYYSPRGGGIIKADDPKNPLGKFWIGLVGTDGHAVGQVSYGIHGNIDPSSIGKQESMGCIRMNNDDVALVFEMLVEGKSTILVRD